MNASSSDPFAILGLPVRFDLSRAEIEARWKELSKALHPDRHAQGSAAERREALSRAVAVNEAYRALRDDVSRAEAVLRLRGVSAKGEASPALLMEVMELRETLAEKRAKNDAAAVQKLADGVRRQADEAKAALAAALDGEAAQNDRAATELSRLRYFQRFLDEVEATEDPS